MSCGNPWQSSSPTPKARGGEREKKKKNPKSNKHEHERWTPYAESHQKPEGEKNHTGTSIAERRVKHKDIKAKCTKQGKKSSRRPPKRSNHKNATNRTPFRNGEEYNLYPDDPKGSSKRRRSYHHAKIRGGTGEREKGEWSERGGESYRGDND